MSNELTCPVCGSHNCWCDEKPTHQHRCLDCKYDGTEPIEWAAVRLCHEQREEIERLQAECVYLESDAALMSARADVLVLRAALRRLYDESHPFTGYSDEYPDLPVHVRFVAARENAGVVLGGGNDGR